MTRRFLTRSFGALLLAACATASAQNAFTSRVMNVRAGPSVYYPLVTQLGPGTPLEVHGCLSDWSWCDVSFDEDRGWIYAGGLSFVYEGQRVPLYAYGPYLGLPIITFSLLPYWGAHYRHRPWYSHRNQWAHRRFPPHLRPRGRPGRAMPRPMPYGRPPAGARVRPRGEAHGRVTPPRRAPRRTSPPRGAQHQQPRRSPRQQQPPRGAQRRQPPQHPQQRPPARAPQPHRPPDVHGSSARRPRPEQRPPGPPPF